MIFKLEIDSENDAMQTADDVSRALQKLSAKLRNRAWDNFEGNVLDDNGNHVGVWSLQGAYTDEEEEESDEESEDVE